MPIYKLKGQKGTIPPRPAIKHIILTWCGSLLFIALLALTTDWLSISLLLGSLGASCVLVFGYPEAPFSQPRNVLAGHCLSAFIGLLFLHFLGSDWWVLALAVSTSIALMMLLRIVHPPAGSNTIIVFLTSAGWDFLLFPVFSGATLIILFALVYNNIAHKKNYPLYW